MSSEFGPSEFGPSEFGERYYKNNGQAEDRPALGWYTRLAQKYLDLSHLLDFGCGTGTLISRLSKISKIDGYDISPFAIERAQANNQNTSFYSKLETIPECTYSAILAIHVIEHLSPHDLNNAINVLVRSLKPSGRLMIVTPNYGGFAHNRLGNTWDGFADNTHRNLMSADEVRNLLGRYGFVCVKEFTDGPWNGPYFSSSKLEKLLFQIPCALQVLTARKFLPVNFGESYVGVWRLGP